MSGCARYRVLSATLNCAPTLEDWHIRRPYRPHLACRQRALFRATASRQPSTRQSAHDRGKSKPETLPLNGTTMETLGRARVLHWAP